MEENKNIEMQAAGDTPEAVDQKPMSEVEMRRAQLEETQRSVQKAKEEIASSRQRASEASKEIASARKAIAEQKKQVRKAERDEKKQKRQEAVTKSKEEMQQELERRKQAFVHTKAELSDKMKKLLSGDIKAMNKWKKTRAAEILAVFAKHNFYAGGLTPVELRTTLEDLGPTYVKIGQIMSSRVDMLPVSYCKELEKLRQNVKELDPEIAKAVIEQETGKKIDELFLEFRDKPLGSASIGQAHLAVLKDGTKVVTKVQRPLIAEMMREDFVLLKKLATAVNVVKEADEDSEQMVDLMSVIEELEKVENEELDFRVEAENTRFFKENCIEDEEKITCPTVIDELTTERLFTMTFVDGYSISKRDRLIEEGYDPEQIGSVILDNYLHQVLDVGTFHADPHQGNIMVSHGKPVWIDFGMIGRISDADVNIIQSLILSLIERESRQVDGRCGHDVRQIHERHKPAGAGSVLPAGRGHDTGGQASYLPARQIYNARALYRHDRRRDRAAVSGAQPVPADHRQADGAGKADDRCGAEASRRRQGRAGRRQKGFQDARPCV